MNRPANITAALASAPGEGAIGIIEVYGTCAADAVSQVFRSASGRDLADSSVCDVLYGRIMDGDSPVDEVLVRLASRDPDRLEINCHGGPAPFLAVMRVLESRGIQRCEWNELAQRAGRDDGLDRIQLEAAAALIDSMTMKASAMLTAQYNGALSHTLTGNSPLDARDRLLSLAPFGLALCSPGEMVAAGRPNVGKSTLVNALLGKKRVIESATPGTTRDAVRDCVSIRGIPFRLVDTAGVGNSHDELGEIAGRKAMSAAQGADMILFVIDGSSQPTQEDREISTICRNRTAICVLNKSDLKPEPAAEEFASSLGIPFVRISARRRQGLEDLEAEIINAVAPVLPEDPGEAVPFTERQVRLIESMTADNVAAVVDELIGNS